MGQKGKGATDKTGTSFYRMLSPLGQHWMLPFNGGPAALLDGPLDPQKTDYVLLSLWLKELIPFYNQLLSDPQTPHTWEEIPTIPNMGVPEGYLPTHWLVFDQVFVNLSITKQVLSELQGTDPTVDPECLRLRVQYQILVHRYREIQSNFIRKRIWSTPIRSSTNVRSGTHTGRPLSVSRCVVCL